MTRVKTHWIPSHNKVKASILSNTVVSSTSTAANLNSISIEMLIIHQNYKANFHWLILLALVTVIFSLSLEFYCTGNWIISLFASRDHFFFLRFWIDDIS